MKTKPLEQKIEEILAYYESDGSNITMPKTVEAISNLVEEEVKKALEFTLKATHSIEYPPSGKTWHFQNEWRNSLTMATDYILEELSNE